MLYWPQPQKSNPNSFTLCPKPAQRHNVPFSKLPTPVSCDMFQDILGYSVSCDMFQDTHFSGFLRH
jgi:hypothetical protein